MPDRREHTYFFLHVMKTGGVTFAEHIRRNFRRRETYPAMDEPDFYTAKVKIPYLLGLPPERKARFKVFEGHFPYAVVEELGLDLVTITCLREPVARTLSYLKYAIRTKENLRGMSLEQVYDDPFEFPTVIKDHQTKVFSMGPGDKLDTYLDCIDVDERRLEIAKANLAKIDVLGLTERYDDFLRILEEDYGWEFSDIEPMNASHETYEVSDAFVERIRRDNAIDVVFYEHAVALVDARTRARAKASGVESA